MGVRITAKFAAVTSFLYITHTVQCQITYTGGTYTQNFDTLATGPLNTNLTWTNNTTLSGWFLFNRASAPLTSYRASTGSDTTGSFYSYGTDSERALGAVGSGSAYWASPAPNSTAGWMAVAFTINTTAAVNSFTISYTGEQWRDSNTTPQDLLLEWGVGSSFTTVTTWTAAGGAFNFTSPQNSNAGAINGNLPANRVTGLGGTVSTTLNIGDTLWIRWRVLNAVGNDHGLSIDDFSFSTTLIPEPQHYAILLAALMAVAIHRHRKAKTTNFLFANNSA